MDKKLVVAMIVQNEQDLVGLAIDSVIEEADKIVIIDGLSKDGTAEIIEEYNRNYEGKIEWIVSEYPHKEKGGNGIQRNKYLDYVKQHYDGHYCLVLDADEVVDDIKKLKEFMVTEEEQLKNSGSSTVFAYDIRMRHLINYLTAEDSISPVHLVHRRFFKVCKELKYPEVEHPLLEGFTGQKNIGFVTLWHFGYARETVRLKKKYLNHLAKSNIHTPQYLREWYLAHLFGKYPKKEFNPKELPPLIKQFFVLEDIEDELYFRDRKNLEPKHLVDAYQWRDHFKPKNVLMCGDGMGQRTWCLNSIGVDAVGFDISKYAIEHSPYKLGHKLFEFDLTTKNFVEFGEISMASSDLKGKTTPLMPTDLVVCYDVLEHIDEKDIDIVLGNVYKMGRDNYLFSIPWIGNPDLENDPTHKIKQSKEWWIKKIEEHGIKIVDTPKNFIYGHQVLVGKKKDE